MLGSAGGPRRRAAAPGRLRRRDFLIVNGDTLTDVDIWALVARHRESERARHDGADSKPAARATTAASSSQRDGFVTGFHARVRRRTPTWHFIGVQVASGRAFARLEDGIPTESVNALYPRLIAERPRQRGRLLSPGVVPRHRHAARLPRHVARARARQRARGSQGRACRIDDSAVLVRSMVWDDVTVGRRAHLHECIVADGARIPDDARYERCAHRRRRWPDTRGRTSASTGTCSSVHFLNDPY